MLSFFDVFTSSNELWLKNKSLKRFIFNILITLDVTDSSTIDLIEKITEEIDDILRCFEKS